MSHALFHFLMAWGLLLGLNQISSFFSLWHREKQFCLVEHALIPYCILPGIYIPKRGPFGYI